MTAKDLKNALLQEAVQGKLVPQIASEGNARDLLNEIRGKPSPRSSSQAIFRYPFCGLKRRPQRPLCSNY